MENKIEKVYPIEELDIKSGAFIVVCSKRASGKSVLARNLVKNLLDTYDYDVLLMFSETSQFNSDWEFIDKNLIYKTSEMEQKLEKLLKIQEGNIKKSKKINILIICDDVIVHAKSKQLINLSTLGRHYLISVICSVQYCKGLCSSSIRNNIDYFIWSDLGEQAIKSVYETIHIGMNFKEFKQFTQDNNHDYQFIMYDSRTQKRDERLKVIKAQEFTNMKLI